MHASNSRNCIADEINVHLFSFRKGTWLGEVFKAVADWSLAWLCCAIHRLNMIAGARWHLIL